MEEKRKALAPEKLGEPQTRQSEVEQTLILCAFSAKNLGLECTLHLQIILIEM